MSNTETERQVCRYCGIILPSVFNYCPSHPEAGGQCEPASSGIADNIQARQTAEAAGGE